MKYLSSLLLALFCAATAHAQTRTLTPPAFSSSLSTQAVPFNMIGTGVGNHQFQWNTTGTVSAGACALQGSSDGVTFGTTIISAQTVTSSGGPTTLTAGVYNYVRLACTTPITGSGRVTITYFGYAGANAGTVTVSGTVTVANGGTFAVQATVADGANVTLGAKTDARSTATDSTSVSVMQVLKEISQMAQNPAALATGSNIVGRVGIDQTTPGTTNLVYIKGSDGSSITASTDPCQGALGTTVPVSVAADTVVISAVSAKKTYICGGEIIAQAAEIVNIVEGTGSLCATNKAALVGSTTDGNGLSLAATGGFIIARTIFGIGTNVDTCITLSGTNRVAGHLTYVQQ